MATGPDVVTRPAVIRSSSICLRIASSRISRHSLKQLGRYDAATIVLHSDTGR
jgi:hypothetical protein